MHPKRKRIYIAGPISKGDLQHNLNQATAAFVKLAKAGFAPFCPHWSAYSKPALKFRAPVFETLASRIEPPTGHREHVYCEATVSGNDEMKHEDWMGVDLPWVEVADIVLRLPGESAGADIEVGHAQNLGIPVAFRVEDAVWWLSEMTNAEALG